MHAPDIMELVLDISSRLQAIEFYIQLKEKANAKATAYSEGRELHTSPCQGPASRAGPVISPPPHTPKATAAELLEVRETVARRFCRVPILTISSSEDESDSNAEIREAHRKRHPVKSGNVSTADSMVVKKVTWPHELVYTPTASMLCMRIYQSPYL